MPRPSRGRQKTWENIVPALDRLADRVAKLDKTLCALSDRLVLDDELPPLHQPRTIKFPEQPDPFLVIDAALIHRYINAIADHVYALQLDSQAIRAKMNTLSEAADLRVRKWQSPGPEGGRNR